MDSTNPKTLAKRDAKVAQILAELAAGEVRTALFRSKGLVSTFMLSSAVRDAAGQAHFAAGELYSAGLHWSLTERTDAEAISCIDRFVRVCGDDEHVFEAYRFRGDPFGQSDSSVVNERLEALKQRLLENGRCFVRANPSVPGTQGRWSLQDGATAVGVVFMIALLLFVFVSGLYQIASWVWAWRWP